MATSTKNILIIAAGLVICTAMVVFVVLFTGNGNNAPPPENNFAQTGTETRTENEPIVVSLFLTLNPVIRIDIDLAGIVMSVQPYNDAARGIVEGFEFATGSPVNDTINELVNRAVNLGVVPEGGTFTVSVNAPDETAFALTEDALAELEAEITIERIAPQDAPRQDISERPVQMPPPANQPTATPNP